MVSLSQGLGPRSISTSVLFALRPVAMVPSLSGTLLKSLGCGPPAFLVQEPCPTLCSVLVLTG